MKREWNTEELAEHWTLRSDEAALLFDVLTEKVKAHFAKVHPEGQ